MEPLIDANFMAIFSSLACGSLAVLAFLAWWFVYQVRRAYQNRIVSRKLRKQLAQATGYRDQLRQILKNTARSANRPRLEGLVGQINAWTTQIEALARRIDGFQQNKLVRRDLARLPNTIRGLEHQLASTDQADIRTKVVRTLDNKRQHLASLERLQETMQKAELEIDHMISSMGIIYSQVITGQSTSHVANYNRLSDEVNEQIDALHDYLEAMEEVHLERAAHLSRLDEQ